MSCHDLCGVLTFAELLTVHVAEVEERSKFSVHQALREREELEQQLQQHVRGGGGGRWSHD